MIDILTATLILSLLWTPWIPHPYMGGQEIAFHAGTAGTTAYLVAQPSLSIPNGIPAENGGSVSVPVNFTTGDAGISSLAFSVGYDQTLLSFDPTDSNGDGIPDAVAVNVPSAFDVSVSFDQADVGGELDFLIADLTTPLSALTSDTILSITLRAGTPNAATTAAVNFSANPIPPMAVRPARVLPGLPTMAPFPLPLNLALL